MTSLSHIPDGRTLKRNQTSDLIKDHFEHWIYPELKITIPLLKDMLNHLPHIRPGIRAINVESTQSRLCVLYPEHCDTHYQLIEMYLR